MSNGQNESDDLPQGNPDWLEHNAGGEGSLESEVIKLPDSGWLRLITDSECIPLNKWSMHREGSRDCAGFTVLCFGK